MSNKPFINRRWAAAVMLLIAFLAAVIPAFAQDSLETMPKSLTLEVGETYTFQNESEYPLFYNSTDEGIISINEAENQITALKSGNVRLFIESFDGFSFATCDVTVSGSQTKDAEIKRSGESFISLPKEDQAKIYSEPLLSYLSFIRESDFTEQTYESAAERIFYLVADVTPGTEQAQSQRALSLGMLVSEPLEELNSVTLMGTFKQILAFAVNNPDLLSIFGGNRFVLEEPVTGDVGEKVEKHAYYLGGNVESLTKISNAHNKGFYGEGMTIVILDTGLNKGHSLYGGRVVAESCRSNGGVSSKTGTFKIDGRTYSNVRFTRICSGNSSAPRLASVPKDFNHGSHVAGIAAGNDGIAQKANIISINIFTELSGNVKGDCVQDADLINALNDVLNWRNTYNIAAINLSIGLRSSTGYNTFSSSCNSEKPSIYSKFNAIVNAGIVPVVAAGNESKANAVGLPACYTNTFTVGALDNYSSPRIPNYSNEHRTLVQIFAPGTDIISASYPSGTTVMSGTSMATPVVAGAFAILKEAYPNMTVTQLENKLINMSTRTVKCYNGYTKPILDFTNFDPTPTFALDNSNIRGKNGEIQIVIPWRYTGRTDFKYAIYDESTGQRVYPTYKIRDDASGTNKIVTFTGSSMVNGKVYRVEMQVLQYGTWRTCTKFGMPIANVYGATVVAGNKTMVINTKHREPSTGTRYMIFDGSTEKELYYKVGTKTNTTWTNSSLTNGKLYYVVAVPYRDYKGQRLWGPNQNRIYFIPMMKPSNGQVTFSGSNATVSIASDSSVNGIRVLYRTIGGALQNGCESSGSRCTIRGLNSNTAYEFYAMKYKVARNKKYYSMGLVIPYRANTSGLTAPQSNPVVAMASSGYTTFTIRKSSNAAGISVLYREGEGAFRLACEASGNSCSTTLNTKKNYTFYIMQYRIRSGKKVYSDGIIARDFSSGKSGEFERLYTGFTLADENFDLEGIYDALDDFYTEEDLLREEAFAAMGEDMVSKDAVEYEDYEFDDVDYSWVDEPGDYLYDEYEANESLEAEDSMGDFEAIPVDKEEPEEDYTSDDDGDVFTDPEDPMADPEDKIYLYTFDDTLPDNPAPSFGNK